jgi:hypothetical protein
MFGHVTINGDKFVINTGFWLKMLSFTVGSPYLSDFLAYRTVPQQTVFLSKKMPHHLKGIGVKNAIWRAVP